MKRSVFSQWFAVLLLFSTLASWASVSIRAAAAMSKDNSAPAGDPTDIETVKQLERGMGDAMVAVDIDKLNQIFADDWATIGASGKIVTKEKVLGDFESGKDKLVSFELGPMDVQVLGDVAVAHGTVTEKRIREGKEVGGQGIYMDLLKKRAGKWVVVRTAGEMVKSGN
jgi:ketosteroid isomerase-like protein